MSQAHVNRLIAAALTWAQTEEGTAEQHLLEVISEYVAARTEIDQARDEFLIKHPDAAHMVDALSRHGAMVGGATYADAVASSDGSVSIGCVCVGARSFPDGVVHCDRHPDGCPHY